MVDLQDVAVHLPAITATADHLEGMRSGHMLMNIFPFEQNFITYGILQDELRILFCFIIAIRILCSTDQNTG